LDYEPKAVTRQRRYMSASGPQQTSLAAPHMSAFGGKADIICAKRGRIAGSRTGVVHRWDAAVASVCIKRDLDFLRSELIRLAGSFSQCSERSRGGCQCRKAFAESSGPEELLALHHYTQS
jgi:hypothetical protein